MPNPKKRAEKQDAAASKKSAAESAQKAAKEEAEWSKGAKGTSKADKDAEKRAEQQRKKDEKARLEAEEAASLPKPKKVEKKKGKEDVVLEKQPTLSATNIDDALDALSITKSKVSTKDVERHPERRFKAAYQAYEETRLAELKAENSGLRQQQMKDLCFKEFQKSPLNPFNQVTAEHNATRDEVREIAARERKRNEERLAQ